MTGQHLLCFGFGFCAEALVKILPPDWQVSATTRSAEKCDGLAARNITPILFDDVKAGAAAIETATHILVSAPPSNDGANNDGEAVLRRYGAALKKRSVPLSWLGYLSTTGVYGDYGGAWIDEDAALKPALEGRVAARQAAEAAWRATDLPVHIFRLAGIYGPYRNNLTALMQGTAKRIVKDGHFFCRIHVDDAAQILRASMDQPNAGRVYNVCDDEPAAAHEVTEFAAKLLGQTPPPLMAFEEAVQKGALSDMAQSFYAASRRVRNGRVKKELGVRLLYPNYRAGLTALYEAGAYGQKPS